MRQFVSNKYIIIAPAVMSFFSIVLRRRAVSTWELFFEELPRGLTTAKP